MNKIRSIAILSALMLFLISFTAFADKSPYDARNRGDIPGIVYANAFDHGGEGVAYHDSDAGNNGGFCRSTDVDLDNDASLGRCYLGWTRGGEWVEYNVLVISEAFYTIDIRVASQGQGGTFHIEFDGVDRTGPITVPDTGDWVRWKTISRSRVFLPIRAKVMRIVLDSVGASGSIGNFDWIRITEEGFVNADYWFGIGGERVVDLTNRPEFLLQPPAGSWLEGFSDTSTSDNQGSRIRGYLHPPATGDYVFWLRGTNESQLYVSTDDDAGNKHLVAAFFAPTSEVHSDFSRPIHLEAGRSYYIETLHKHESGFNEVMVGWIPPGTTFPTAIPRIYLSAPLVEHRPTN